MRVGEQIDRYHGVGHQSLLRSDAAGSHKRCGVDGHVHIGMLHDRKSPRILTRFGRVDLTERRESIDRDRIVVEEVSELQTIVGIVGRTRLHVDAGSLIGGAAHLIDIPVGGEI